MVTVDSSSYPRAYFGETIKPGEEPAMAEPVNPQITDAVTTQRTRKKSAKITAQQKAEKQRRDLYLKQESRRATKVQVDQKVVLWTWIVGIVIAFTTSAVVSFNGITAVAQYVGLAAPWMASLFFFFVELMYVIFLIAYLLLQSRVDEDGNPERSRGAFWGMFLFGAIAVIANGFHTLDFWQYEWTNPQMWAGVVLSIAAPIAIISASKMASRVVFARAIRL